MASSASYPSIDETIELRVIREEDCQRVLDFAALYFYREDPLSSSCEPKDEIVYGENILLSYIKYDTSLMAVDKETGEIVGLTITGPKIAGELEEIFKEVAKGGESKLATVFKFLAIVENNADLFTRYNVERVLFVIATCVRTESRGKNIGARLYNGVHDLGKDMGYELLASDCASFYSARIKERLGWDCVYTVYYKDYSDDNNKPVFTPPAPHVCCKTCAIRL